MEELKLFVSKTTVKMLNSCVRHFCDGPFDAINIPLLLNALVAEEKSFLKGFLEENGATELDFEALMPMYLQERAMDLVIRDEDKFDGVTQEEAEQEMPMSQVPFEVDDDVYTIEDMDKEIREFNDEMEGSKGKKKKNAKGNVKVKDRVVTEKQNDKDIPKQDNPEANEKTIEIVEETEKPVKPDPKPLEQVINEIKAEKEKKQFILMQVKDKNICSIEILEEDPTKPKPAESKKEQDKSKEKPKSEKSRYRSEIACNCILFDGKMQEHWYPVSNEFMAIINEITVMAEEYGFNEVEPVHFTIALFRKESDLVKQLVKDFEVSWEIAKSFFTGGSALSVGIIPFDLQGFITCLNDKIDRKKPCQILERDKESKEIWNICLKMTKRNVIIVGEAGVGKSALAEKVAYDIVTENCPERFKSYQVLILDVNSLIAGTMYRGDAEKRIEQVINFLKTHDNVILFIDEVHTIVGAGACREGDMDFANALKPLLARGETVVIGATTSEEYEMHFARDKALSRRFEMVEVKEPMSDKVYPMIKNKVKTLSEFHNVNISKKLVEYAIMISNCFNYTSKNPDRTLDVIDKSMVNSELAGRKNVTKTDILETYGIYFETFEKMTLKTKMETAYHEMGHYVFVKLSPYLINRKLLAVSIMPAKGYLGITCSETRYDVIPHDNRDYYIDLLAELLAGRVSEKMYTNDITAGARTDLDSATQFAHNMISKYGMDGEGKERNFVYLNTVENPMLSEKVVNDLNEEVKQVCNEAYKRAEEVIHGNKELIEALVKAIMKKHIMSETELDAICQNFLK